MRRKTSYVVFTLIAVGVLGCVIPLVGGGIYYVVTDTGTIAILTDDEKVQVLLLNNGQEIEILDGTSMKTWSIRAGTYTVRLKDDPDTLEIGMPDTFELKRGGKHIVTIRKVPVLAERLLDADAEQFAILFPRFNDRGEQGVLVLTGEIDKKLPPDAQDDAKETLAKRQANAAVALLRMNQAAKVWPLLQHSPDPRVRSYLIHRLGPLGADAGAIVKQLDKESDLTIRRALVLSLGEFSEKDFTPNARKAFLPKLQEMYRTASDPGFHAATEWLLRQWKEEAWLKETNQAWAGDKQQQLKRLEGIEQELKKETSKEERRWYVNGEGQTLVVIPGPVVFMMGSPPTEKYRTEGEAQHWRRIGRSFAIASKPVTVEQFLRLRKDHAFDGQKAPSSDCPVNNVTWYDAAAYCNWLSEQEGIPQEQWCYEPNKQGKYDQGMRMAANYLQGTGYRLPTEAEWEFSCRAGAATRCYFGDSDELLPRYAWYQKNSQNKTWPVGSLKPNDLGLFDMAGHISNWCQDAFKPYGKGGDGKALEDIDDITDMTNSNMRVLRGGWFLNLAAQVRSANRSTNAPAIRSFVNGFRPARTLPFSSFNRYGAAVAAALAAAGQGKDEPPLDDAAKAKFRRQALDWLKAELKDWTKVQPPRLVIVRTLWHWQQDSALAGIRDATALAKLPAEEQKAFTRLWAEVAKAAAPANNAERLILARALAERGKQRLLDKQPAEALADLQTSREIFTRLRGEPKWTVLTPVDMKTENGSKLELQKDGSVFVHQPADTDTYSLVLQTELKGIKGLRLEALADSRLPGGGPGWGMAGNFVLSKLSLEAAPAESPDQPRAIALRNAWADFSQQGFDVRFAVDGNHGNPNQGWALSPPEMGKDHTAVFDTAEEVGDGKATRLTVRLDNKHPAGKFVLGRFRLSFTTDAATLQATRTASDLKDSELIDLYAALGTAHAQQGQSAEAVAAFAQGLVLAVDRAGKARIIAAAAPLPAVLKKLDAIAAGNAQFQTELARHFAERGDAPLANAARTKARTLFEQQLAKEPENAALADDLAELLLIDTTPWTVLKPTEMKSQGGATLALQPDGSVLAGGTNPAHDVYSLLAKTDLQQITAIRLEALPDPSLPANGPGRNPADGNFHLNKLRVFSGGQPSPLTKIIVVYANVLGDAPSPFEKVIEGELDDSPGWGNFPRAGKANTAIIATRVARAPDDDLKIEMYCSRSKKWKQQNLGRFRLSVSGDPAAFEQEEKRFAALRITDPWAKLAAAYALNGRADEAGQYFAKALQGADGSAAKAKIIAEAAPLPGVLEKLAERADNAERTLFAQAAYNVKKFAFATRLWAEALATDPKLSDDRNNHYRYDAARAAVLAGSGQGKDEPPLDDASKAKLRGQALDWLKTELADLSMAQQPPLFILQTLSYWQQDSKLAGIRDKAALAKLPADEQKALTQLWSDVAELLTKTVPLVSEAAIKLKPENGWSWVERGWNYADVGQWDKASADFVKGTVCKEQQWNAWYSRAMVCLHDGDLDGYRKICAEIIERFLKTDAPVDDGIFTAWTCLLTPDAGADPAQMVRVAEKALAKWPQGQWQVSQLGTALYRAGRYEDAVKRLTEASALNADPYTSNICYTWFFLAMAHHRLGHADEARHWLDKATQAMDEALKVPAEPPGVPVGPTGTIPPNWNRKLTLQLFRREAEEQILGPGENRGK